MKKQVMVIHGGDAFKTYEEYIEFLKEFEINLNAGSLSGWKRNLQTKLGDEYQVIQPEMPNYFNVKYLEWKIWFEKFIPFFSDELILVGHSFGGTFLVKYLSEETFPKKIKATFLVSPPFDRDGEREVVEIILPEFLTGFNKQAGKIFIYHSKDDPIVPFSELEKYMNKVPQARVTVFENRGHFTEDEFSEILDDIKSL